MAERYSIWSLLKHAMGGHKGWERAWRDPEPKKNYDVVIIGGGGHGLATAYYLAKEHGLRNIAVIVFHSARSSTTSVSTPGWQGWMPFTNNASAR